MVKFYLNRRKDKETSVIGVIHANNKVYKYSTRIVVLTRMWNSRTQRLRSSSDYPQADELNASLKLWEELLSKIFTQLDASPVIPSQEDFKREVEKEIRKKGDADNKKDSLTAYAGVWINSVSRSRNTIKRHVTIRNMLLGYEKENGLILFQNVNTGLYNHLKRYLEQNKYALNTIGDVFKSIKVWMGDAQDEGLHRNTDYRRKDFRVLSEEADSIYLSVDELTRLHNISINYDLILDHFPELLKSKVNINRRVQSLIDVRDRFLLGAFTALRYQDYSTLVLPSGESQYITARSLKTGVRTTIPIHYIIREIIERRGGGLPPAVSNQKMNKALKRLGKIAHINDPVEIAITRSGARQSKIVKKYELITTHTARRSACTNMYLAGIPVKVIMAFSGHKTIKSFLKYIKVGQFEDAVRMQDHPYFTGL